jgi:hypothetical protein
MRRPPIASIACACHLEDILIRALKSQPQIQINRVSNRNFKLFMKRLMNIQTAIPQSLHFSPLRRADGMNTRFSTLIICFWLAAAGPAWSAATPDPLVEPGPGAISNTLLSRHHIPLSPDARLFPGKNVTGWRAIMSEDFNFANVALGAITTRPDQPNFVCKFANFACRPTHKRIQI